MKRACSLDSRGSHSQVQTPDVTLVSRDGRFRVYLGHCQFHFLLELCRDSGEVETGGLLIGRYNDAHDTAEVMHVLGPPSDSVRRRNSFWRGVKGIQSKLNSLWKSGEYYLGEWHHHPDGAAWPSPRDMRQMMKIAESQNYCCPEPILLVVGGSNQEVVGHVLPRGGPPVMLKSLVKSRANRENVHCGPA